MSCTRPPQNRLLRADPLAIPAGAATAIIGANGSGKSPLLKALLGLLLPASGSVSFGGVLRAHSHPRSFTRHVTGMVASPTRISGTLRDNPRLARPDADDAGIVAANDAAGLGPWLAGLPDGLETRLGSDRTFATRCCSPWAPWEIGPHYVVIRQCGAKRHKNLCRQDV